MSPAPSPPSSNALFRATFEQAAVGIAHVSRERRILRANRRFAALLGRQVEELVGRHIQDFSHPDDIEQVAVRREPLYRGELDGIVAEKRYLRPDGEVIWLRVTISLAHDERREPEYEIAVYEDISERKREESLLAMEHGITR